MTTTTERPTPPEVPDARPAIKCGKHGCSEDADCLRGTASSAGKMTFPLCREHGNGDKKIGVKVVPMCPFCRGPMHYLYGGWHCDNYLDGHHDPKHPATVAETRPTPETDALQWPDRASIGHYEWVKVEVVRQLERQRDQLLEDVAFLLTRARMCGCFYVMHDDDERDYGASANSIVAIAYGADLSTLVMPGDAYDLAACELAFAKLPEHRKNAAMVAMEKVRASK